MSAPAEQLDLRQAQSVALPKRWPLVSKLQARNPNTPLTKDARLINCYAEYDAEDKEYWIYKRLGVAAASSFGPGLADSFGMGIYQPPASTFGLISVFGTPGGGLAHVYQGAINLGAVNGSAGTLYTFEAVNDSVQGFCAVLNNGINQYAVKVSSGALFNISAIPNTAPLCPGWANLDGTLYAMDTAGNIWGSNLNSFSTWNALNVILASSNQDLGVAIAKQLSYVLAFKQYTTQVFYDAGNATGSPLSPVPDAQLPLGCLGGWTVKAIDNTVLWMTSNETISPQIVQMDNLTPHIVSTPAVERILDNLSFGFQNLVSGVNTTNSGVYAWVLKHGGHRFYGLNICQLNITLVYDLDQKLWYIWTDSSGNFWPYTSLSFAAPIGIGVEGLHYVQDFSAGSVRVLDGDYVYPNDRGIVFPVDIYTPNMDFDTVRAKTLSALYFNADKVSSVLRVRRSDDDYQTWSNFRTVDLSRNKPSLDNEGTFERRRAYHLRHQANTAFRIKTIDMQMDIGIA